MPEMLPYTTQLRMLSRLAAVACVALCACASSPSGNGNKGGASDPAENTIQAPPREDVLPENVATAMLLGSALLESGDVRAALPYYEFIRERMPEDREIGQRYVEVCLRAGQPRKALDGLNQLQTTYPDDADLAVQRIRLFNALGEGARARELLAEWRVRAPQDEALIQTSIELALVQGDGESALSAIDALRALHPRDVDLLLRRAEVLISMDRGAEAERALDDAFEIDPGSHGAVDLLSEILREEGRTDELRALLEGFVARVEDAPMQQARLADLYLAQGDVERSVELLLPLARRGELDERAQVILADLLASLQRKSEALGLLDPIAEDPEASPLVLRMLGELHLEGGDLERAEPLLRRAVAAGDPDPDALVSLLLLLGQKHPGLLDTQEATDPEVEADFERWLDRAVREARDDSLRQTYLVGAMLRRRGAPERAIPMLERAVRIDPANKQALYELAISEEAVGDFEAASTHLAELVRMDPDDAHLLNFYGYLLADRGVELVRAERLIRRALEQEPDNGAYIDSLGWVLYRQGKLEEALEQLIDAANRIGDDPVVLQHLGDCLRDLDQKDAALRTYRRALAAGGEEAELGPRIEELEDALVPSP